MLISADDNVYICNDGGIENRLILWIVYQFLRIFRRRHQIISKLGKGNINIGQSLRRLAPQHIPQLKDITVAQHQFVIARGMK